MSRAEDWPLRLNAAIESARERAFVWGEHDCALFAANIVRDLTGIDYAEAFRGKYRSATGATRVLAKLGRRSLRETVTAKLGAGIQAHLAQRGDVLLWIQPGLGETVGVCLGRQGAFVGPKGLEFIGMREWAWAWRV